MAPLVRTGGSRHTGLAAPPHRNIQNTRFVNQDSGRSVSLEHAVQQIQKGNSNYANYEVVNKANGTMYIRSKPDGKIENNIE